MLTLALSLALLAVIVLIVVRRRHLTLLMSLGSLIAALLAMLWLQDLGLLPGTQGPLTHTRPQTLDDARR
ncbi:MULTISPECIES: hypothetical protein [Methylorubrum]|jgi:hypothetical protein|uniref:Uncharacterized protein n=3 Tax=Methylorubrum TaxID=2282523 RepID=A0A177JAU2_9HYPH|nr:MULTISPECIES: hypothetical protein [Methylorubrum]ACB83425.1 conserved hypothetical protein [Methylorubrum populi BJ001]KAB7782538.1 hypothetical protein F8B43_5293 [Methylorubrum populi]MBA8912169.1 hypothetical protein [Methylorubrum thiocyanatum]OAH38369.1 hypothetical protein AX289_13100 [Methylorubrum populi]PZP65803.1 MAG: hypothetical protein DI590_26105 [Methylorubrum populi]